MWRDSHGRLIRLLMLTVVLTTVGSACDASHTNAIAAKPATTASITAATATSTRNADRPHPRTSLSVSRTQRTPAKSLPSRRFHTRPSEFLVLLVTSTSSGRRQPLRLASSCGLRWSRVAARASGRNTAKVWRARATQSSSSCKVDVTPRRGQVAGSITVLGFMNGGGVGAHGGAKGAHHAPSINLRPRYSDSAVYEIGIEGGARGRMHAQTGSRIVRQSTSAGARNWVERYGHPTIASSRVTLAAQRPASGPWNVVAFEVTPRPDCASQPAICGFPSASSTGVQVGKSLHQSGSIVARQPGQVIQNLSLTGGSTISVQAQHVIIRNVRMVVSSSGGWGIIVRAGGTATIDHVDISGDNSRTLEYAILVDGGGPTRIENSNLHNCTDCIQGEQVTAIGNYIHDLANPPGAHVDGIQCNNTCRDTIIGNTIENEWNQTSDIALFADFGTPVDSTISGNLLAGGGYSIYGGGHNATGIKITNNRFAKTYWPQGGRWGVATELPSGVFWSANIWDNNTRTVRP